MDKHGIMDIIKYYKHGILNDINHNFIRKKYPLIFRSPLKNIKKNDQFLRSPAASASSVRRDCLGSDPAGSTRLVRTVRTRDPYIGYD